MSTSGYARVRVVVEVDVGPFGDDSTLAQLFEQGRREALGKVEAFATKNGIRLIGAGSLEVVCARKEAGQ